MRLGGFCAARRHVRRHQLVKIARQAQKVGAVAGKQGNGPVRIALRSQAHNLQARFFGQAQLLRDVGPEFGGRVGHAALALREERVIGGGLAFHLAQGALDATVVFRNGDFVRVGGEGGQV